MNIGYRTAAAGLELSDILPADVEAQVKKQQKFRWVLKYPKKILRIFVIFVHKYV